MGSHEALIVGHGLVPEKYIYKKANVGEADLAFDALVPMMDCLSVDVELLRSSSEPQLSEFRSALTTWGCFQIVNHGIPSSFLNEMRQAIKQFFDLPLEEKLKYSKPIDHFEGYVADTFVSETKVTDWVDRMHIMTYPIGSRNPQFWPQTLRDRLDEYTLKVREIREVLLKAAARSLGVDDESFVRQNGTEKGRMLARLNMYRKCPLPERVLGLHPHTDASAITVVLQDNNVESLQVCKDDQWFKVPAVNPGALFINVGDELEIMSNGVFKSPKHRVVASAENERISLSMFCSPDPNNQVGPIEELITEDRPQMYKSVKNYADIFFSLYKKGITPLSSVKLQV